MEYQNEALGIIRSAEQSLADLAQKALVQRDYPKTTFLMGLAEELRDIAAGLESPPEEVAPTPITEGIKITDALSLLVQGSNKVKLSRKSPKKGEFPKFLRDEGNLYKIGWSKADRATYEHKAPKHVLLALIDKLKVVAAKKRRFTMEHILPLIGKDDQAELPSYQVYLCIAWLRKLNLITQYGRKGYSISHPAKLEFSAEKAWQKLPSIETAQV